MRRIPLAALIGLFFTGAYFFCAIFAAWIAPYGMAEVVGDTWEPWSSAHLLGTDTIGRDLLGRPEGLRLPPLTIDLIMSIPSLISALVVLSVMPVTVPMLILVMGILDATRVFRLARAVAVDITVMDYVEAARLRGEGRGWIIFREILPNALSPLVAEMGLRFIFMVLFISTLSFLGLGVQPPMADWGGIVKENKEGIVYGVPAALIPAVAIATLAISVNLVADWILNRTTSLKGGRGA